jgi:protein SCO1
MTFSLLSGRGWRPALGALFGLLSLQSCDRAPARLKTLGFYDVVTQPDGRTDTVWASIRPFSFTDQNGQPFTNRSIAGKVMVADFFFASCPSICPVVKKEELRLWERFKNDPRVVFVSHTIDPRHDSISVLRDYADRLGVGNSNWYFVTGPQDTIYATAERYLIAAQADSGAPGGFNHSGNLTLIDQRGRIRASYSPGNDSVMPSPVYDGLKPADVDRLILDVDRLLKDPETSGPPKP